MNYGVPYQGSKSRIARWVISHLPKAETLYDVFAGGCAITHVALISNRFKRVVCNDITDAPSLFLDAVNGKFHDCDRWVSREEFEMFKDTDPFVRIVWSFGNNNKTYLYHRDVEPFKRELHKLAFSKTPSERVLQFEKVVAKMQEYNVTNLKLQSLQSLKRLQNLERLNRLQSHETLKDNPITVHQGDYRDVPIEGDCVIYCDPPYKGTAGYTTEFDHDAFYDWCRSQTHPIYISEYSMPDDFACIDEIEIPALLSQQGGGVATEKLFTLKKYYKPFKTTLF